MSFLRIRSPYHEPRDIPLGPNHARVSARMGIRGGGGNPIVVGSMVTGIRPKSGARAQAEYKARQATG